MSVRKVLKDPKKSQKGVKISVRGLLRHFFDTLDGEAWEDLFETFGEFRGLGVWRLLYMGIAIVTLCVFFCMPDSLPLFRNSNLINSIN